MENKKLNELTNEELLKKRKGTRFVAGIFIGAISFLLALNLYNIYNGDQKWFVLFVPLGLMPIALVNYKSMKKIDKELKSRNI
ncbi:MAG: redox-active disulfide protein 2 [Emticicia sp.]|nr:redox-active disulfide protein 2 [Emticicia sp.]